METSKRRIPCSCGGENERCYKCDGRGWYTDADPDRPLKLPAPTLLDSSEKRPNTSGTKKVQGKRRRIILDNPLPPALIPRERQPKRGQVTRLPPQVQKINWLHRARLESKHTAQIRLCMDAHEFLCSYPSNLIVEQADVLQVAHALMGSLVLLDRDFFETRSPLRLEVLSWEQGVVVVRNRACGLEKFFVARLRKAQPIETHKRPRGDGTKQRRGTGYGQPKTRLPDDERASRTRLDGDPTTAREPRELDATRDHWRIRDHGQFGSSCSYDDYDE